LYCREVILQQRQVIAIDETTPLASPQSVRCLSGLDVPTESCIDYVQRNLGSIPELEHLPLIIEKCRTWLARKQASLFNQYNLTENEIMAIALYTIDVSSLWLGNQPRCNNIFYQLNNVLRKRDSYEMKKWEGYIWYLQSALSKLPDVSLTVYRGIEANHESILQNYKKGRKIQWSGYSSTTTDLNRARKFAREGGVIVSVSVLSGKVIQNYSYYALEAEVLLSPNLTFTVVKDCKQEEDGTYFVKLVQDSQESKYIN